MSYRLYYHLHADLNQMTPRQLDDLSADLVEVIDKAEAALDCIAMEQDTRAGA